MRARVNNKIINVFEKVRVKRDKIRTNIIKKNEEDVKLFLENNLNSLKLTLFLFSFYSGKK